MTLVAGVDCSTQATKVVVCDAASGEVVREARASHPDTTEIDPNVWWHAFEEATSAGVLDDVRAISVGGQQHGMVLVDDAGDAVRDALLWNDNRSAAQAEQLIAELGGPEEWARTTGSVPVASFTISKLRWVRDHEPAIAEAARQVLLPHDWLTHRLRADGGEPTTDRGDASGTGYWSPHTGAYDQRLLRRAFGREVATPRICGPAEAVGETGWGAVLGPGTGDNMAAALGLDLEPGDVVVSLGTSGTAFARASHPTSDPTGSVAGFADAQGAFLPLVCTLNAARVLEAALQLTGTRLEDLDELALSVEDSGGLVLLPYLDGERTPALPDASGLLYGLTRANATRAHLVRASVEGMMCGLAEAVEALRGQGVRPQQIVLIGGAARSRAVQHVAATLFGLPVNVPEPGEYVARGAARQAAWALAGTPVPPAWEVGRSARVMPTDGGPGEIRDRFAEVLRSARPMLTRTGRHEAGP